MYALVWQIDYCGIAAVFVIVCSKVTALIKHHLPECGGLYVLGAILDIIAKEEEHRDAGCDKLLIGLGTDLGSKAWLDGNDGCDVVGIGCPSHTTALRVTATMANVPNRLGFIIVV